MKRIAAAIWAGVAALGILSTVEPLHEAGVEVGEMRALGAASAVLAAALLVLPARVLSRRVFTALLFLMTLAVGALTFAGGDVRGDLVLLYTFVAAYSAYFFSLRTSVTQLALVAVLLAGRMLLMDDVRDEQGEWIRLGILIPGLVGIWALVWTARRNLTSGGSTEGERHESETGLLSASGMDELIDAELSRAARHARPLALILVEVSGRAFDDADPDEARRLATVVARTIVSDIRAEDQAARLARQRFAVLATETTETGAEALTARLTESVRKRLVGLGYDATSFSIAVGWADYQYDEVFRDELVSEAEKALAKAILANEGIGFPQPAEAVAPPPGRVTPLPTRR